MARRGAAAATRRLLTAGATPAPASDFVAEFNDELAAVFGSPAAAALESSSSSSHREGPGASLTGRDCDEPLVERGAAVEQRPRGLSHDRAAGSVLHLHVHLPRGEGALTHVHVHVHRDEGGDGGGTVTSRHAELSALPASLK